MKQDLELSKKNRVILFGLANNKTAPEQNPIYDPAIYAPYVLLEMRRRNCCRDRVISALSFVVSIISLFAGHLDVALPTFLGGLWKWPGDPICL